MINMDNSGGGMFDVASFQDITKSAESQSRSAPGGLRRTVYLYYLSRYYLSLYEATFSKMPNQVLNEYRNGLDHLMRFLSGDGDMSEDDKHRNLSKMEGHMQRALLDLCKHYVYGVSDWADKFEEDNGGLMGLSSIFGGEFAREWGEKRKGTDIAFMKARIAEFSLGEDDLADDIVKRYLSVAHESHRLMQSGDANKRNIA